MFTKKHFESIARVMRVHQRDTADPVRLECMANDFADLFANSNPRFDRARFMAACGFDAPNDRQAVTRAGA